MGNQQNVHQQ